MPDTEFRRVLALLDQSAPRTGSFQNETVIRGVGTVTIVRMVGRSVLIGTGSSLQQRWVWLSPQTASVVASFLVTVVPPLEVLAGSDAGAVVVND
jgi:hypothetical protein